MNNSLSPNTNIDELFLDKILFIGEQLPDLNDNRPKFVLLGTPAELIAELQALLSAAKIEELRLLLSLNNEHITGDDIRERIKELVSRLTSYCFRYTEDELWT